MIKKYMASRVASTCCTAGLLIAASQAYAAEDMATNLATAEGMLDAFYAFDSERLQSYLSAAGESGLGILSYQAWAEGGNYKVVNRPGCSGESASLLVCPVTVQDDPVLALEVDFNVTDTFHITFEDGVIVEVDTNSNDQPIYYEARVWISENLPEVMEGPCKRTDGMRDTPGDCARAMTDGYKQFMVAKKAEPVAPFIPADFAPPELVETENFKLVPLGPDLVDLDYEAYMSSIEHLQETFTRSTRWPRADISSEDAMQDMLNEQARFNNRESFAYAVLSKDGEREMGCVYVRPISKEGYGYEAEVALWVTKTDFDAGFDEELYEWTQEWMKESWPFDDVAYPGRAPEWDTWDQL
ncbi:MAG: hypothetical protein O2948_07780 [Proteobacteria bacterium]|nr:hypothetical protein [Pseudomonadota bacterium]MDA0928024.1 hypothetical protein [Pseudomonadota bacterium]